MEELTAGQRKYLLTAFKRQCPFHPFYDEEAVRQALEITDIEASETYAALAMKGLVHGASVPTRAWPFVLTNDYESYFNYLRSDQWQSHVRKQADIAFTAGACVTDDGRQLARHLLHEEQNAWRGIVKTYVWPILASVTTSVLVTLATMKIKGEQSAPAASPPTSQHQ